MAGFKYDGNGMRISSVKVGGHGENDGQTGYMRELVGFQEW